MESVLTSPTSIAHIVLVYALVISVGLALGRIKVFGVSLGVTFVLFVGLAAGHFGMAIEPHVLTFLRDFGLILFIFFIGLQVGPSFFRVLSRAASSSMGLLPVPLCSPSW